MIAYIQTLRPKHWFKNLFIFAPAFFALQLDNADIFFVHLVVFFLFSLLTGAIYTFNDLIDKPVDIYDSSKQNRPVINGKLDSKNAWIYFSLLSVNVLGICFFYNADLVIFFLFYFLLNILYTLKLKHILIVDVITIGLGFLVRLFIGAEIINLMPSLWIISITFLSALFFGFSKRYVELLNTQPGTIKNKAVLEKYSVWAIKSANYVIIILITLVYIFYSVADSIVARFQTTNLIYTSLFVIAGFGRYVFLIFHKNVRRTPVELIFSDGLILLLLAAWAVTFYLIVI